jgi:hypothetical protein
MDTDQKQVRPTTPGDSLAAPGSTSRRRLLRAGLAASPAILTIVSQPVLAVTCRSPSSFASIAANAATSSQPAQACTGLGPQAWSLSSTAWPVTRSTALFYPEFSGSTGFRGIASPTLDQVLALSSPYSDVETLARNVVAAYLNLKSLKTPDTVINETSLQAMWTLGVAGTYRPTLTGAYWTFADLNAWFTQTYTAP